jgi:hypothetical protein
MKDAFVKRTETVANIAVILLTVGVIVVLVKNHVHGDRARSAGPRAPAAGAKISLPDIEWADYPKNLLLVISTQCRFCSDSAPFYRRLMNEAGLRKDTRVIALLPQEAAESRRYLTELNVPVAEVLPLSDSLDVTGSPTLILVDGHGVVRDTWLGQLDSDKESELLKRLMCEECGDS